MNVYAALQAAQTALKASNPSGEEKQEAQLLLAQLLGVNHAWLIAHSHDALAAENQQAFQALVQRRMQGEPIAHILGERDFYGLTFKVTPDTLIPRPDTETLVEAALAKLPLAKNLEVLDLGTGSGAVALAIAYHRPQVQMTAVDCSEKALTIAKQNAQQLKMHQVRFVLSDWFDALADQTFDMIVSNPPYVEAHDAHLSQGDLRFEPLSALVAGTDGLADIRLMIKAATKHLKPQGWLMLEHGYQQASQVASLFSAAGFSHIQHGLDLAGIQRVTLGQCR